MRKRVLGIIVGALLIIGLMVLAWLWFLGRSQDTNSPTASSTSSSRVPTTQNGGSGYSSDVSVGEGSNTSARGTVQRITGGTYNAAAGTYTLGGGTYNPSTGTYTLGNNVISGGTYNRVSGTYTVTGGTYTPTTNTYTTSGGPSSGGGPGFGGDTGTTTTTTGGTTSTTTTTGGTTSTTTTTRGNTGTTTTFTPAPVSAGVTWIPDTGNDFNPTAINGINDANPRGPGTIFNPTINTTDVFGSDGLSPTTAAIAALGAGAIACTGLFASAGTAGVTAGAATTATLAGLGATAGAVEAENVALAVPVNDLGLYTQGIGINTAAGVSASADAAATPQIAANSLRDDLLSCIARGIARAILAQMTQSIVNWINGGFNGKPAFLQNSQAFFANAANQAAGRFISGSGLAFLCSPFSLQIKIAIAQAYANRSNAPSCTLTQVINNVNGFMRGNFASGGWPGLLSFTTVPTNNPYGAFAYGQIQLNNTTLNAQARNGSLISPTGFVASVGVNSLSNCSNDAVNGLGGTFTTNDNRNLYQVASSVNGKVPCPDGCDCKVTTPGQVISDSLSSTNKSTFDSLNMAKNFDEIINALLYQLVTKTLQGGLSHLSDNGGYGSDTLTPAQNQASTLGSQVLSQLQQTLSLAQQYGGIQQGMIGDLQSSQSELNSVANCWTSAATSSTFSASKQATARNNASSARTQIATLQEQVTAHNGEITQANSVIAQIEQLQTSVLNATSLQDVQDVKNSYDAATLFSQTDITNAQQDRTTLQSQLSTLNQQTSAGLQQCYAFAQTP